MPALCNEARMIIINLVISFYDDDMIMINDIIIIINLIIIDYDNDI